MSQQKYQIVLSVSGNHSVVVTRDGEPLSEDSLAWASETYTRLVMAYGPGRTRAVAEGETPVCLVHHKEMVQAEGKNGTFWTCREKNLDGSFCSYRPRMT